ncbi:MAG TPA: DUF6522 family protein [Acetobacteraceae bacterium]|nr:DUF6522 family protein [Acetobacteraceae bacterium]
MTSSAIDGAAASAIADPPVPLDAGIIAPMLGLSPETFMRGVQRGMIVQRTERGLDEDAGWFRVTFRFRRRRCRIRFNPDTGTIVPA